MTGLEQQAEEEKTNFANRNQDDNSNAPSNGSSKA